MKKFIVLTLLSLSALGAFGAVPPPDVIIPPPLPPPVAINPPGALTEFSLSSIRSDAAPVVNDVVKALAGVFGLLFAIVIIRFGWRYTRGAFGR